MKRILLTTAGKLISHTSKLLQRGNGSTWPGHIALSLHKNFVRDILKNSSTKIILVIGTNGKTTTAKMITTILEKAGKTVIQNTSGANLLNGIASTLLLNTNLFGQLTADYAVFEVDENNVPFVLHELTPTVIVALNLFRDQLDRYGELDAVAKKWDEHFAKLPPTTTLILNADDPLVAYLGHTKRLPTKYFGLDEKVENHATNAADSLYCPRCNHRLQFKQVTYAHLGDWICPHCGLQRPQREQLSLSYPLSGTYNKYNALAAALATQTLGLSEITIQTGLNAVTPAFGRQEKITKDGKTVQIFLSKNPTSMNESLSTVKELGGKYVLFVLNDRIPDGRDISWIWDIEVENFIDAFTRIFVSGDRVYDMALRIQYAGKTQTTEKLIPNDNLSSAMQDALIQTPKEETLYILPTYSAMLEVRKILTGKEIL